MPESDEKSPKRFKKRTYDVELGYCRYDTSSDKISFPVQLRERHLTPGKSPARLQAIGPQFQISIWSERDCIMIRIPLEGWRSGKQYKAQLAGRNDGMLSVGRFEELLRPVEDKGSILGVLMTHNFETMSEQ
jgi:hypothetical protein